jgi:macrolide phosphotransferase
MMKGSASLDLTLKILELARAQGISINLATARLDETGWDFHVVHGVDDHGRKWILRAPKRVESAKLISREYQTLALVRGSFPVQIPDWKICTNEIIAYLRIDGQQAQYEDPYTSDIHWNIDRASPSDLYVETLGQCMAVLHRTSVTAALKTGLPYTEPDELRSALAAKLERAVDQIGMHKTWEIRGRRWIENDKIWPKYSVLIHGDMKPRHTLVDKSAAVIGVLDWADAEIGDPGQEFIAACRKFEAEFLDRLITAYTKHGGPVWQGLREHALEGIAFAPMLTGLQALDCDQPSHVRWVQDVMSTETR